MSEGEHFLRLVVTNAVSSVVTSLSSQLHLVHTSMNGWTPLQLASFLGNKEMARVLLRAMEERGIRDKLSGVCPELEEMGVTRVEVTDLGLQFVCGE